MIVDSDPFTYDVNAAFHTNVVFSNSDPSTDITLSIKDHEIIKDVIIRNSKPHYTTDMLVLNETYTLELKKGDIRPITTW